MTLPNQPQAKARMRTIAPGEMDGKMDHATVATAHRGFCLPRVGQSRRLRSA
jgi:hypothetical protein